MRFKLSLILALTLVSSAVFAGNAYKRKDIVADQPEVAKKTDPNFINPWGILIREHGTIAIAENGSHRLTLRKKNGNLKEAAISVAGPPTGVCENSGPDFIISNGVNSAPARIIIVTQTGQILGWNAELDEFAAVVAVDNSGTNTVYTGVTRGKTGGVEYLYVANFGTGVVEMYDTQFQLLETFTDETIPEGYAPFNVRVVHDQLYVVYAQRSAPDAVDAAPGPGSGFVDIFDLYGNFTRRFISQGVLNAPWGIVKAPDSFKRFSNEILVANFGDGAINAFDKQTGDFLGPLRRPNDDPIVIDGARGLAFGVRSFGDCCGNDVELPTLFFTAGPAGGIHGLFGFIRPKTSAVP